MNNHCDSVIRSLEDHSSRLNKEAILEAEINNAELWQGFELALSPFITFGVKKVPIHGGPDGQGLPWIAFTELCTLLSTRKLTGDAARSAVELALTASKKNQWNDWYRRILIKDLRCGVSEKTINKIKKNSVPLFECMLAHDGAKHEEKVSGKKLLEPKLDGVRCLTFINYEEQTVIQYSRNGKVLENFSHITNELLNCIEDFERSYVIDGEINSTSFQKLMTQVNRKSDIDANDAYLMAFDIIPLSEFHKGKSKLGQKRRSALLKSFKPIFDKVGNIQVIDQKEVDLDTQQGQLEFKEFNKQALKNKFEGIMIKDIDAPYVCKRHVAWLKQKPFIELSLTAISVEEGTGKNVGKMGAVVFEGTEDDMFIRVSVGGGWSDEDRENIWKCRDEVIGQIGEIRADAITKSQDSDDIYSLRFPRFKTWRGFNPGEKI